MAFLLLRIPLAAEVERAALAVGHLTANLLIPDCTVGEILYSLVKRKSKEFSKNTGLLADRVVKYSIDALCRPTYSSAVTES